MKNVSKRYREKIEKNREFLYKADITFADGKTLKLSDPNDLMHDGIKITSAVSGTGSFDIGAAVIGELTLTLNNKSEKFSLYDFYDAVINMKIGLRLDEETVEFLYMGKYTVDDAVTPGCTVVISALDEMCRFERDYINVSTAYPATLLQIIQDICVHCAVPTPARFDNSDYVVESRPEDDNMTCLGMISYVAQIVGCFAKIDESNALTFQWYNTVLDGREHLDGGRFTNRIVEQEVDGGDFTTYAAGIVYDGGNFQEQRQYAHIYALSSLTVGTDEIIITGVKAQATGKNTTEDNKFYLYGEEGYVLSLENNPLVLQGKEQIVAEHVGRKVIGMKIRTFDVSAISNPCIEAGDCAYISDRLGNSYPVYITNITFQLSNYEKFSCGAETPSQKRAKGMSALTKAIIAARKIVEQKITAYDLAVQRLTDLMANSFGVYKTEEKQEDGSFIYYMHDKPTVGESKIIWKMTASAMAVSTDGGKTWNAGMDASGNMIVSVLSAIGINADWINAGSMILGGTQTNMDGSLKVYDKSGKLLCSMSKEGINFDTPNIKLDGNSNMTLWGDVEARTLNVQDQIKIATRYVPGFSREGKIALRGGIGNSPVTAGIGNSPCLYIGEEYGHCRTSVILSPFITTGGVNADIYDPGNRVVLEGANAFIDGDLLAGNLRESYYHLDQPINGNNCSVDITFRASGAFVVAYGTYYTFNHKAGKTEQIQINEGIFPKHVRVRGIGYDGKKVFVFSVGTDGVFSARNASETDISSSTRAEITFRMDYTTL